MKNVKRNISTGASRRICSLLLCFLMLASSLLTVSCGKIKDLAPYKEEFVALIEQSFGVNEIFFGEGLPVYSREESFGELHYSVEKNEEYLAYFRETTGKDFDEALYTDKGDKFRLYYWLYRDPALTERCGEKIYICKYTVTYYLPEGVDDKGNPDYDMVNETLYALKRDSADATIPSGISVGEQIYKTATGAVYYALSAYEEPVFGYEYGESDNAFYDVVRADCGYEDINAIKAAAEQVYSKDYLEAVYSSAFDGIRSDYGEEDDQSAILYARYIEESDGEGGTTYLKKSNLVSPLYETQRTYDYDTMKLVKPYNKDRVNVTLKAYGLHYSADEKEIVEGEHTVRLSFVLEDGEWRLDSPTY